MNHNHMANSNEWLFPQICKTPRDSSRSDWGNQAGSKESRPGRTQKMLDDTFRVGRLAIEDRHTRSLQMNKCTIFNSVISLFRITCPSKIQLTALTKDPFYEIYYWDVGLKSPEN